MGFMVEDLDRGLTSDMNPIELKAKKIYGQTAIPAGRYRIGRRYSPLFKRVLPWLLDVPGFQFIYIHPGNYIKDTKGCLLPGKKWGRHEGEYAVAQSRIIFEPLCAEIFEALDRNEEVWYEIKLAYDMAV